MFIHVVSTGDTITSIAQQYGVPVSTILWNNGIPNPAILTIGQALLILIPELTYTVQQGDTLESLASQFSTSVLSLLRNNPRLAGSPYLTAGETVVIRYQSQPRRQLRINGYAYPYISESLLTRTLPFLTTLTIFGYGFTPQGDLVTIDDQPLINLAYQYQVAPVLLFSSLTQDGTFNSENASLLFRDLTLQNRILDQLTTVMIQKGYLGLDIDFEYIKPEDKEPFLRFLSNTVSRMHAQGFFVNTDVAPKTSATQAGLLYEAHDYARIGEISDTVFLMTYEWGYVYSPPMAVAPLNQVRDVVSYAVSVIPREKLLLGIPNYGYDWILPFRKGDTKATAIGNDYAVEIAVRNRAEIQFDSTAQSPYFSYTSKGLRHIVWFEDVRSIQAKLNLLEEYDLLGAGYWNIMNPFTQNWAYLNNQYSIQRLI